MPLECVAIGDPNSDAWKNANCPAPGAYRFGYVANFTQSYLQVLDLDASSPSAPYTFEQFVFTLGTPKQPKGQ